MLLYIKLTIIVLRGINVYMKGQLEVKEACSWRSCGLASIRRVSSDGSAVGFGLKGPEFEPYWIL